MKMKIQMQNIQKWAAKRALGRARGSAMAAAALALGILAQAAGCSSETGTSGTSPSGTGGSNMGGAGGENTGGSNTGGSNMGGAGGAGGAADPGPNVDVKNPQLYKTSFTAKEADAEATLALGTQLAFLDTNADPRGILVVYLHGAGAPPTCGSNAHGEMLASLGFHVLSPCYLSDYGVGNCNDDIEGCRLEAFEGVDHHAFIDVKPSDSAEMRITKGLQHVQEKIPQGDWTYFIDGEKPKWSKIIISGISHGASSSAVIGKHRLVHGVVSLSGPLDSGQAWLKKPSITPIDRFFAFTHTDDGQHAGHLQSFADLGLVGDPAPIDGASPPYGGSHRLVSSAATADGHGATQAGGPSPKDGDGAYLYLPVWTYMYAGQP
ncbi:MAG: hypothetical protein HUU21_07210 [Polyangiaceae bacterium]|nr:hypothetical protein [Polyangiaceae bacterium]NUQ73326.1 hypothetical protein [Polyangiaceae bacterium]